MKRRNLDKYKEAYNEKFKFHDENILILSWYGQRIVKIIKSKNLKSCLSLGIGHKIVSKIIISNLGNFLDRYTIIEGSQEIIKEFKDEVKLPSNLSLVNSLFEEFETGEKFDAIEMGFILEHVDNPLPLIKRYLKFLKPKGLFFIAVPNARSLHRLIGNKAGMLDNLYKLSKDDIKLGHKKYFDKESLTKLIIESGLKIVNTEGIFLKPFSTSQLESLHLSPEVLNALFSMAEEYSEISNAIYVEATL